MARQANLERAPLFCHYNGLLSLLRPGNNIRFSVLWHQATARTTSRVDPQSPDQKLDYG